MEGRVRSGRGEKLYLEQRGLHGGDILLHRDRDHSLQAPGDIELTYLQFHPSLASYFLMISRGLRSCSLPGRSADTELCLVAGLMLLTTRTW